MIAVGESFKWGVTMNRQAATTPRRKKKFAFVMAPWRLGGSEFTS
jgi:hypothetical protein